MSKLNSNNIDVQRILNVLQELYQKMIICSFLSYHNLDEKFNELTTHITNEELLKDLTDHFELIKAFREKHIEIKDEDESNGKPLNEEEEEKDYDEDRQANQKDEPKEKENLLGITEDTSDETKNLAKSCRNFCRKYYRDEEFLQLIREYKAEDEDIDDFITKFGEVILPHYIKKTKMTLEEEESETNLNTVLRQKINDLQEQIRIKTIKYNTIQEERKKFNENCKKKINDIKKEIEQKKSDTTKNLNALIKEVNTELTKKKEENERALKSLHDEHKKVIDEFNENKTKDLEKENGLREEYEKKEKAFEVLISEYDAAMFNDKTDLEEKTKEKEKLNIILNSNNMELDTLANKYNVLKENFLVTQQKCKDVDYLNKVKERSVEWIQAQYRGYFIRKTMKKKYKFLNALTVTKKPKEEDVKGKGKGKKK